MGSQGAPVSLCLHCGAPLPAGTADFCGDRCVMLQAAATMPGTEDDRRLMRDAVVALARLDRHRLGRLAAKARDQLRLGRVAH